MTVEGFLNTLNQFSIEDRVREVRVEFSFLNVMDKNHTH